jgi:dTDP-4-amino-4,6-dideoxygalactose transaminase
VLESLEERQRFIAELADQQIMAVFHYAPLHLSAAGKRFGRAHGELPVTESVSERLVRLPLWVDMTDEHVERVVEATIAALSRAAVAPR